MCNQPRENTPIRPVIVLTPGLNRAAAYRVNHTPQSWLLLKSRPESAACNMAIDEALLEFARSLRLPVLRFYGWIEPAATFGYFQRYANVAALTLLRPLVRRPTGGGLVAHNADWTYSVVVPPDHDWYRLPACESYARIHGWLQRAFGQLDVPTALAPVARREAPGQCFLGAEKSDLIWQGRKIAGAAQRRNRCGLLIQGSVQPPILGLARSDWEHSLCTSAAQWKVHWSDMELGSEFAERTQELVRLKYSLTTYNQRR